MDVHEHIKRQVWTSVPAFVIAVVVFFILGLVGPDVDDTVQTEVELLSLNEIYNITPNQYSMAMHVLGEAGTDICGCPLPCATRKGSRGSSSIG